MIIAEPGRYTCGVCGHIMWVEKKWVPGESTVKIRCTYSKCHQYGIISEVKLPIAEVVNVVPAQDPSGG